MKIWFVHHYAYTPSQSAGTRHHSLARELIKRGHEVLVVSCSFYHKGRRQVLDRGQVWRKDLIDGVPFLWLRAPGYRGNSAARLWNMLVFAARVWRRVGLRHEPPPDVILGSSPDLFTALAAQRLAKALGTPFVLELRDFWPDILIDMSRMTRRHPLMWLMTRIEHFLYRRADSILSVMEGAPEHIVPLGVPHERIEWLPNGVALDMVPPHEMSSQSPFVLMYAGVHGHYNALDVVLEAAEILAERGVDERKVMIRLVGEGPLKPRLQEDARRRGLRNVTFEDAVPKKQVYSKLAEADAYLMVLRPAPIFRFGVSPNKLWDYMAMSRPIIYSVNNPFDPVAKANAGISIPPGDAVAMADAMQKLAATSLEERAAMGARARSYVEEFHSFEKLGARLEKLLGDVCRSSSPPGGPS